MAKKQWSKQHSVTPDPAPSQESETKPPEEVPPVVAEPAQPWRRKKWNPAAAPAAPAAPASNIAIPPASSVAADEAQAKADDPNYRPPSGILIHKGIE